ncbi:MAG: glycosyltransferase family 4 protein [Sciscionella sp.]
MRILIHSNAPWCPTGYGQQVAMLAPRLAAMGHDVAISAYFGLEGSTTVWNDLQVYPRHIDPYGSDVVADHARTHFDGAPGLVLTLSDVWVLSPRVFGGGGAVASWVPVDCDPLSTEDRTWLRTSGVAPIAMSRHGHRMLTAAGFEALYVPHGINTQVFTPQGDPREIRESIGIPADAFIVGINAANKGNAPSRKAFPQQIEAFARLRKRHDDTFLLLHTETQPALNGMDLKAVIKSLDLPDGSVGFSDQYRYRAGLLNQDYMASWYNCCDVVSNATYGEGFGLPTIEAQACGVPVVVTDNSASAELVGAGWKVPGDRYWSDFHRAWWSAPNVDHLAKAYEKAYDGGAAKRRGAQAREFALDYDADRVLTQHWKPTLEVLEQAAPR